jgi:hypothetical protein
MGQLNALELQSVPKYNLFKKFTNRLCYGRWPAR